MTPDQKRRAIAEQQTSDPEEIEALMKWMADSIDDDDLVVPPPKIDYQDLLRRYIKFVDENEGVTHIGNWDRKIASQLFSPEERAVLEELDR